MPDWFVKNVADMPAASERHSGKWVMFEPEGEEFPHYGRTST